MPYNSALKILDDSQHGEIKAILASIAYLEAEAKKNGLIDVGGICRKAINDIEMWIKNKHSNNGPIFHDIVGKDLYNILELLNKFSNIDPLDLSKIIAAIETYDTIQGKSH